MLLRAQDYVKRRQDKGLPPLTFKLVGAQTVSNPFLEQRFRAAQARLAAASDPQRSGSEGFHGTHPSNVKSICNKGLLRVGHKLNGSEAVDEGFFGVPEYGINLSRCELWCRAAVLCSLSCGCFAHRL
jgi:hypothetical protein